MKKLPDIQENTEPEVNQYINRVGINNIKVPILISHGNLHKQVQACFSLSSDLDCNTRAISMSMFLRILKEYIYNNFNFNVMQEILKKFKNVSKNKSHTTEMIVKFDLPFNKKSPKSNIDFPIYYPCIYKIILNNNKFRLFRGITVPYTSYCPCSYSLVESAKIGIPHNQRSYCSLYVELPLNMDVQFIELINLIESRVVNIIHPILRRMDEQYVAIKASENKFFIEDIIRRISYELNVDKKIKDWIVICNHEESLHQHDAFSISWKGIKNGFNENTIIC